MMTEKDFETIAAVRAILLDVASIEAYRFGLIEAASLLGWPYPDNELIDRVVQIVGGEWVTASYAGDTDSAEKLDSAKCTIEKLPRISRIRREKR